MGSRNRQRPTFEKRQREIARQERQAEKRARRRARAEGLEDEPVDPDVDPDAPPLDDDVSAVTDQTVTPGLS